MEENKVIIQETASNQAQKATDSGTQFFPKIPTGGRRLWRYEVIDMKAAEKAGLTITIINEAKVKEVLADKRDKGVEVTENGIRYFIDQKY